MSSPREEDAQDSDDDQMTEPDYQQKPGNANEKPPPQSSATPRKKQRKHQTMDLIKNNHVKTMNQFVHTELRLGVMEKAIMKKQDETIDEVKKVQSEQKRLRSERNRRHHEKKKKEKTLAVDTLAKQRERISELKKKLNEMKMSHNEEMEQAKKQNENALLGGAEGCYGCAHLVKRLKCEITELKKERDEYKTKLESTVAAFIEEGRIINDYDKELPIIDDDRPVLPASSVQLPETSAA